MTTSGSPYKSVQGVGKHLRPTATDLGKGSTTKEEDAKIRALMGPRVKANKTNSVNKNT